MNLASGFTNLIYLKPNIPLIRISHRNRRICFLMLTMTIPYYKPITRLCGKHPIDSVKVSKERSKGGIS